MDVDEGGGGGGVIPLGENQVGFILAWEAGS